MHFLEIGRKCIKLHALFQTSMQFDRITRYDEWFATSLLVDEGRCRGCTAIELRTGEFRALRAKAVIICTGGAGRIFPFTTNGAIKTGDGMALAYRAGVALEDLEFVQYHPTGLPGSGILITEASRGEGGILVNNKGRRYLRDYDLGRPLPVDHPEHPEKRAMELGPRDRLSQAFEHERQKGNTFVGPYGDYLLLDIRHLGERLIDAKLPFVRELSQSYARIDPVHEPIPVRPVVHYMMGGIATDNDGATSLPGLFAAGECACVSINGANRLGSNSLTELVVFGARAGRAAATFAQAHDGGGSPALSAQTEAERDRVTEILHRRGEGERIASVRDDMTEAMETGAGIYRTDESLRATSRRLTGLRERFARIGLDDHTSVHNTELTTLLELDFMLDIAQALASSALARTESRGSHQRIDHPERNDVRFLAHSLAYRTEGDPRIEYKDVVITKWPPGERRYGTPDAEARAAGAAPT